ncbi:MAG: TatD family hydrolase [Spiribacter sp.]|jgi:TatD DNase family protein|nr:TatD family hydrolase [Spiribacter sp.]MDR9489262.1 TatD family hydrolase [Spiribacter sp.]
MPNSNLVDIGVNLTHSRFSDDRSAVIERAHTAGVSRLILTGVTLAESQSAADLASRYPGQMHSTAGVHPHHASDWNDHNAEKLSALLKHPCVSAVGETGLDYHRDFSPRISQQQAFKAQLALAAKSGLPVFCHERDAADDFIAIIQQYRQSLTNAVVHCFTGDRRIFDASLALDLYLGVTGWICDERRGSALRAVIAEIPLERLMIETDAPFLLPRDLPNPPSDRRNEPSYLPHILATIASLRAESIDTLAAATQANSARFFRF